MAFRFCICNWYLWAYEWTEHQTSSEGHFCSRNVLKSEGFHGEAKTIFLPDQSE